MNTPDDLASPSECCGGLSGDGHTLPAPAPATHTSAGSQGSRGRRRACSGSRGSFPEPVVLTAGIVTNHVYVTGGWCWCPLNLRGLCSPHTEGIRRNGRTVTLVVHRYKAKKRQVQRTVRITPVLWRRATLSQICSEKHRTNLSPRNGRAGNAVMPPGARESSHLLPRVTTRMNTEDNEQPTRYVRLSFASATKTRTRTRQRKKVLKSERYFPQAEDAKKWQKKPRVAHHGRNPY